MTPDLKAKNAMVGGLVGGVLGAVGWMLGLYGKRELPMAIAELGAVSVFDCFVAHLRLIHEGEFKRARRYLVFTEYFFDARLMPEIYEELPEHLVLDDPGERIANTWNIGDGIVATSPDAVLDYATRCIENAAGALTHLGKDWTGLLPDGEYAATSLRLLIKTCERAKEAARSTPALRPGLRR